MSQVSVEPSKESVIRADNRSLGPPVATSPGEYKGIRDVVKSNKVRDSWSDITDALARTGYWNGEEKVGRCVEVRLPSPLYNRDPGPYFTPTSPTASNHPLTDSHYLQENEKSVDGEEGDVESSLDVEQARLEELVAMCCEYERQAQLERNGRLTQNRIKTNGSLTRDKRPPLSPSPSPRLQQSFSFDTSEVKSCSSEVQKCVDIKAPPSYENMVMLPGSPRPRIRTNPSKDGRDFSHESSENRIPLCLETEHHTPGSSPYVNILPSMLCQTSHINQQVELRNKPQENFDSDEDSERRSSIAEINANNKYNFLGFDPRKEPDKYDNLNGPDCLNSSTGSEPLRAVLHSSPSWTSPTIDYDSYPDYDTVEDQADTKPSKLSLPLDDRVSPNSNEIEALRNERTTIMNRLASLKSKVSDLELQEEQQMRDCEIESVLMCGEVQAEREKLKEEELRVIQLKCKIQECEIEMEKCLAEQDSSQKQFRLITDRSKHIIQALDSEINSCRSHELRKELYESLTHQIELLDAEKKAHEDLEFRLLEEEASWLSRREDVQREMSEAVKELRIRQERLARLESPRSTSQIDIQRVNHLKAIEQDRSRLKKINEELERLSALPEVDSSSSTTDEEVVRVRSGASVDDLDRISRVTSTTPIDMCNSLGRKTIRSLQEIERNRHLHMAKQGSLVIQEERQRVEELKKRVQDEVKAQWAQQKFNHSLTSLASDESSLEPARDSGLGSEEPDKRNSPDEDIKPLESELIEGKEGGESRPLSDASTCSEEQHVRLRSKSSNNLQRPLTRYLPIRGEGLDLRQHVLEAGHQVDLCPGIMLDSTSCRGFLLKLGSRWPRWNKRWFVFDRTKRCLAYFSDKNEKKIRGGAYFQAIEEVYVDHQNSVKSPNPKVTFVVKSANRTFHLVAPSPEAMRIWVDVIFTGAEGYQQYTPH